jgi:hypothetical protein
VSAPAARTRVAALARFLLRLSASARGEIMDKTLRIVLPLGVVAFVALMTYAMTLQLRIWHVMAW